MLTSKVQDLIADFRRHDSVLWRRAVDFGVTHGPDAFVRYSPPVFGLVFGAVLSRQRSAVVKNLRRALGRRSVAREVSDVARVFTNFASCLTESFVAGSTRSEQLVAHCVRDENYLHAVQRGRGVIVVTAHTGGWQAAGPLLRSVHHADVLVVMQNERDHRAQALHDEKRDRAGIRLVHIGESPLDALPLLAHLRRGGVVAAQIDRLPKGMRGRKALLFGEPWVLPEGPFQLAAVSGASIVPAFTRRVGYMEYEIIVSPAIELPRKPTSADVDEAAQHVATEMERFVRANPTQWFHFE